MEFDRGIQNGFWGGGCGYGAKQRGAGAVFDSGRGEACFGNDTAPNPSAMDPVKYPPYMTFPVGSVRSVTLMLMYDDGDIQEVSFERAQIQMP